jgi:hypothetical protein
VITEEIIKLEMTEGREEGTQKARKKRKKTRR